MITDAVTAIVPMRHDSERVRGKNWRELGSRPLYRHVVDTLLAVEVIESVVIDTDSPTIANDATAAYHDRVRVRVVERPEHFMNPWHLMVQLYRQAQEREVVPEFELFDPVTGNVELVERAARLATEMQRRRSARPRRVLCSGSRTGSRPPQTGRQGRGASDDRVPARWAPTDRPRPGAGVPRRCRIAHR